MPSKLEVGDILIEMDGTSAEHSLMWVGDDKPIVHNAEGGDFVGVIRQSAKPYLKTKDASKEWKASPRVYRSNGDLGARAADFAIDWATRSDDQVYVQLKELDDEDREQRKDSTPRQKRAPGAPKNITIGSPAFDGTSVVLDTPFSQDRLDPAQQPWTVLSLFRALRAYHRATNQLPLSQLKGVTCSQFITYCYQAAAIQKHFGDQQIPPEIRKQIPTSKKFYSLSLKTGDPGTPSLIENALNGIDTRFMPQAMLADAKTASAARLMDALHKDTTGFRFAGYLAPTTTGKAILVPPTEFTDGMTWGDLRTITG